MRRIAMIVPFALAIALEASAGVKVNPSPHKPKPQRVQRARWSWVAELGDKQSDQDYKPLHIGCFPSWEAAHAECDAHPTNTCEVYQLLPPHDHKRAGGGK